MISHRNPNALSRILFLGMVSLMAAAIPVSGELSDLGNGTVYDSLQNLTWVRDANLVMTLCNAGDPLWQSFDPAAVPNSSGRNGTEVCSDEGSLNWYEATAWVEHLNANLFLGFDNWRLPATAQPDPSCAFYTDNGIDDDNGPGCLGSELGHLWTVAPPHGLGNPSAFVDVGNGTCPIGNCLLNSGPFIHFALNYWSRDTYAPDPNQAWRLVTGLGHSQFGQKTVFSSQIAWPVREGRGTPSVLEIPTLSDWTFFLFATLLAFTAIRRL